jgi:hypothetical protein
MMTFYMCSSQGPGKYILSEPRKFTLFWNESEGHTGAPDFRRLSGFYIATYDSLSRNWVPDTSAKVLSFDIIVYKDSAEFELIDSFRIENEKFTTEYPVVFKKLFYGGRSDLVEVANIRCYIPWLQPGELTYVDEYGRKKWVFRLIK